MYLVQFLTPPRQNNPELLDEGAGTLDDVRASLHDLKRLNRYLGGTRAVVSHLYPRLRALSGQRTVVDIGTGDASLPLTIEQWAHQQSMPIHITALDLMPRHLQIARQETQSAQAIQLMSADALRLPFADQSVDYVVCSLLLHHFTQTDVIKILKESYRCARHGIIMSDLIRGWLPLIGYKIIQPIFNLHPITRQDGETSIRRGFTMPELTAMADAAALTAVRFYHHPMFRMTLVAER
jgi:ubiquinone/menaquinone biosynthesis C-methylase UbiE